jgi:hypothetical protein
MMVSRWRLKLTVLAMWGALSVLSLGLAVASAGAGEFEFKKAFGPDGGSLSAFSSVCSTATDTEEDVVYVLACGEDTLYKFDFEGNPVDFSGTSPDVSDNELSGLTISDVQGGEQVAVNSNSHIIYVTAGETPFGSTSIRAFQSNGEPALFTKGPNPSTNEIGGFSGVHGVSVDSNGNIYVSGTPDELGGDRDLSIYSSSGALLLEGILEFPVNTPLNIAVDSTGLLYLLLGSEEVFRYSPSEYPVTASTTYKAGPEAFDPNYTRSIAVNPLTDELYALTTTPPRVAVFNPDGDLQGTFGGPGQGGELLAPEGIAVGIDVPDLARAFVGQNPAGGPSQVKIFREKIFIDEPTIESATVEAVTSSSARLQATINPNSRETTYWFEYGLADCAATGATCTQVPLPGVSIGDGRKSVAVTQLVTGLEAETIYHFRVVAENEIGRKEGPDKTLTTQPSGLGFDLSDARAWEMVSPPNKFGGSVFRAGATAIQASLSGDRLVYASRGSIVAEPAGNRLLEPSSVLAIRGNGGIWSSNDLTAPHSESSQVQFGTEFKLFSPELREAVMEQRDGTPLSPEASEQTPYRWSDGIPPQFRPLVIPSNVPPETVFGPVAGGTASVITIEGASPDLEHIVIRSTPALAEDAPPKAIYLWNDGGLEPVSEPPEGEAVEEGEIVEGILGSGEGSVRGAVSEDGSRVFWAPTADGTYVYTGISLKALYLRNTATGESTRLDVPQEGVTGGTEPAPAFDVASGDGNVVFFTDSQRLTANASATGRDLYRCEVGQVENRLGCVELTDISAPLEGSGESAIVMDQVSGLSEDGTVLYFVAQGVLDETANEGTEPATPGEPNLYLWQEGEGARFIATLADQDSLVWGGQEGLGGAGAAVRISAGVSPSGRYFAFTSTRSLTGYENVNSSGQPNTEVFLYEADDGRLTCVSCNPSGAAAVGERLPATNALLPQDPAGFWRKKWVAATLPEATDPSQPTFGEVSGRSFYSPRSVLDNGRVFFNAADALVPADSNGNWDVYQYEPLDLVSCAPVASFASVSRSGGGCVGLLSSGTADGDSGILDASASGNDVFFLTMGKLSVLDRDDQFDVYDARVDGIPAVLEPVKECAGEACQPAVGAPNDPTPASESFKGAQSPVNCRKGQRKIRRNGKTVCVRKMHKKHGKHHKKRNGKNGRAGR